MKNILYGGKDTFKSMAATIIDITKNTIQNFNEIITIFSKGE